MVLPLKLGINSMASHVFGKAARHGGGEGAQLAGKLGPVSALLPVMSLLVLLQTGGEVALVRTHVAIEARLVEMNCPVVVD